MSSKKTFLLKEIFSNNLNDIFSNDEISYDIIMPILNTNPFFEQNLISIYNNICVNRLLIGDAGSTDESLEVLKKFPRVEIIDHKNYKTSGVCVADLINRVKTRHFFYLHSDIYIPNSFVFDSLLKFKHEADWVEGFRDHLYILKNSPINYFTDERSYSGIQLGNTELLQKSVGIIEDGDLQRNEDIVITELVKNNGGVFIKVKDSVHIHQVMDKDGLHEPKLIDITVKKKENKEWEVNNYNIQIKGIVKHTIPKDYLINEVRMSIIALTMYNKLDVDFLKQLSIQNPSWKKYLRTIPLRYIISVFISNPKNSIKNFTSLLKLIFPIF